MDAKRLGVVVLLLVLVIMLAAAKDLAKKAGYHATLYADNIEGASGVNVDNIKTSKIQLDDGGSYVDVYANGGTLCVNAPDMCKLDIKSCERLYLEKVILPIRLHVNLLRHWLMNLVIPSALKT